MTTPKRVLPIVAASATAVDWNAPIKPGRAVGVGFIADTAGPTPVPAQFLLDRSACS